MMCLARSMSEALASVSAPVVAFDGYFDLQPNMETGRCGPPLLQVTVSLWRTSPPQASLSDLGGKKPEEEEQVKSASGGQGVDASGGQVVDASGGQGVSESGGQAVDLVEVQPPPARRLAGAGLPPPRPPALFAIDRACWTIAPRGQIFSKLVDMQQMRQFWPLDTAPLRTFNCFACGWIWEGDLEEAMSGRQGVNTRGCYLDEHLWSGMDKMGVPPLTDECIKSVEALWAKPDHEEWTIGILPVLTWLKKLQDLQKQHFLATVSSRCKRLRVGVRGVRARSMPEHEFQKSLV